METTLNAAPELPATNSVAALLLLVIANRRSARMLDVTDDAERFAGALAYAKQLGWELTADNDGTVYVSDNAQPRRGFASGWEYLRHRVNATDNFKQVVRQAALPRISSMTRQLTARPSAASSGVTLSCDYGNGEEVTTVVPTQTPDAHDTLLPSRGLAVSALGAVPLGRAVLN